ncbi:serine hydrolase domain-containing protein [Aquimarina sp. 2201CG14-23]|uniref:serine hydrolase domain-containing protein n=1 Tax=Aquimarina mycalae TaxID=3040073 RepID=UPI002477CCA9|nr:serine hydrolase domain-containing protein [Aquimarina sp. 2201CG14-23]MDH7445484.1 serine hydrolase domain-containing protein [Aquimarina sp. 2201CG14-23]
MKKRFIIAPSMLLLIALLFPLISANQIDSSSLAQQTALTQIEEAKPVFKNPLSDLYKQRLTEAIEAYFNKAIAQKKIIGAAVGVVKCDSMVYLGGFGKRNSKENLTIDAETVFRIGSVSKGFAGILAGIQVQEGKLNWDDKVQDHIPTFQLASKKKTEEITLSHILSHTSGLPYHSYTNLVEDGVDLEVIAADFKKIQTIGNPGSVYSYQNAAFALGGTMIEKVTGNSYSKEIADKIFTPLDMTTASTDYQSFINTDNIAYPHRKRYGRYRTVKINQKYYNAIAAGGVNASVTDMSKYMRFLLGHNQDVLGTNIMNEVFNSNIQIEGRSKYYQKWSGHQASYYGLGWRIHTFKNNRTGEISKMIHHGGHVNSYRSEIAIYPEEDLGITVLFNSPTKLARTVIPDIKAIVKQIMELPEEEFVEEIAEL